MRDTKEEWKDVEGYKELYQVSNLGRIKSVSFRNKMVERRKRDRILKLYDNKNGYQYVSLCKNNIKKSVRVHKLVACAFVPNPENKPQINHINGVKNDNRAENLEWCSQSENQIHAYRLGLQKPQRPVMKKVIRLNDGKIYESVSECARNNDAHRASAITRVCNGDRSNYKGNMFAFYKDYINDAIPKFKGKFRKNRGEKNG